MGSDLKGVKPGKSPTNDAIKNSEIFPETYNVFRNDRGILGGGVFNAVQKKTFQPLNVWTLSLAVKWNMQRSR